MMSALRDTVLETQGWYSAAGSCAREALSSIRMVTSCCAEEREHARYTNLVEAAGWGALWCSAKVGAGSGLNFAALICTQAVIVWEGGKLVAFGTTNISTGFPWSAGDIVCPICLMHICIIGVKSVLTVLPDLISAKTVAIHLGDLARHTPQIEQTGEGSSLGLPLTSVDNIEFRDVTFAYPSRPNAKILKSFSLQIVSGTRIGIVASRGPGRGAVVSLLERFYDPDAGQVLINGVDLRSYNLRDLRKQISLVSQEPVLFAASIRENITSGGTYSGSGIRAVCMQAQMEFLDQLPNGLDTNVGAGGGQFSGSQKQRIAIARALLRKPKVLLLEDATAVLDVDTAGVIGRTLAEIVRTSKKQLTVISVTREVSAVVDSDVICVLKKGVIVEQGTHNELKERGGEYQSLVESQERAERQGRVPRDLLAQARGDGHISPQNRSFSKFEAFPTPWRRLADLAGSKLICAIPAVFAAVMCAATEPLRSVLLVNAFVALYGDRKRLLDEVSALIPDFFVLAIVATVSCPLLTISLGFLQEAVTAKLRTDAYLEMLRVEVGFHDDPAHTPARLSHTLEIQAYRVGNIFCNLGMKFEAVCCLMFSVYISVTVCWPMAVCFIVALPILVISAALVNRMTTVVAQSRSEDAKTMEAALSDALCDIRVVRSIGAERHIASVVQQKALSNRSHRRRIGLCSLVHGFSQGSVLMAFLVCFLVSSKIADLESRTAQEVMTVLLCITFSLGGISNALFFVSDPTFTTNACRTMFELLDRRPLIDGLDPCGKKLEGDNVGNIEFKAVRFCNPAMQDVPILHGVNFKVKAGDSVGLIGPSHGGKSAILALLQRFYDPTSGKVLIGSAGVPLNMLYLRWWRSKIGYVSSEPLLFERSARENLVYGRSDCPLSHLRACMDMSGVDFIDSLDDKLGLLLTEGHKRHIAVCRAVVRDPAILLVDEMTSLDEESQRSIELAISRCIAGRTSFQVACTPRAVEQCSVILVCSEGVVAECGDHDALIEQGGIYAKLRGRIPKLSTSQCARCEVSSNTSSDS